MANSAQAKKRARQAEDSRQRNASQRSAMRTTIKALKTAIEAGDKETATTAYKAAVPALDRMARKGIIHKNAAARSKSRLNTAVRAL
ncbi:30S ribosomal protein S20 [Methylophaga sp. 42_8_T64]|nr:30S ribosomal protein S20 [Methylophaga sp. 41_12_T18]OUR85453.1 30S ribosomal protein S20 [Methylophaga sp. 42_8_T64]